MIFGKDAWFWEGHGFQPCHHRSLKTRALAPEARTACFENHLSDLFQSTTNLKRPEPNPADNRRKLNADAPFRNPQPVQDLPSQRLALCRQVSRRSSRRR